MNVKQNEIYSFLGPNGAGKTTVMKMIANLLKPTSGEIELEDPNMKVLIYYFTGTGNSLLVARKIAERLDGAVMKPITELIGTGKNEVSSNIILMDADAVGFVFPVYFDRIPAIILKAIEIIPFEKTKYYFAATTSGWELGNVLYEMDSVLRSRGVKLSYGIDLAMADNSIILRTSSNKAEKRMKLIDQKAGEIAVAVKDLDQSDTVFRYSIFSSIFGKVNKFAVVHYFKAEERKVDMARCNRCGTCSRLCPVGNIVMTEGEVNIGDNCQWCFACLNWCPQKAIKFGRIDPSKRSQYRCPGLKASDIICSNHREGSLDYGKHVEYCVSSY